MLANQIRACQFEKCFPVLYISGQRTDCGWTGGMETELKGCRADRQSLRLENARRRNYRIEKEKRRKEKAWKWECGSWRRERAFFILAWRLYGKLDISSRSVERVEPLGLGGSRIVRSDLGQTAPKAGTHSTNSNVTWERAWKLAFPDLVCVCICGPLYVLCWPLES